MRVSFSHGRGVAAALIFGAICSGGAYAAPDDVFLQAEPASGEFSTFRAEGSYDMVNSTVDVFNLRGSQGMPDNAGDYRGGRLMLGYKLADVVGFGCVLAARHRLRPGQQPHPHLDAGALLRPAGRAGRP